MFIDLKNTCDDRGAYLPSQFRIAVETRKIQKRWTDKERLRRLHCRGTELGQNVSFRLEPFTIQTVSLSQIARSENLYHGELVDVED